MADRMTPEQVAALRLPEGWKLEWCGGYWSERLASIKQATVFECDVARFACSVANGFLPLAAYDWAIAAYDGKDVPTPEQWEAAVKLAELMRTRYSCVHPRGELSQLCDIISPPAPVIEACPRCGRECHVSHVSAPKVVICVACNWCGPSRDTAEQAIAAHNSEARRLRASAGQKEDPKEEPVKSEPVKDCDTCKHEHVRADSDPCESCRVMRRPTAWTNWEPKP